MMSFFRAFKHQTDTPVYTYDAVQCITNKKMNVFFQFESQVKIYSVESAASEPRQYDFVSNRANAECSSIQRILHRQTVFILVGWLAGLLFSLNFVSRALEPQLNEYFKNAFKFSLFATSFESPSLVQMFSASLVIVYIELTAA